MKKTKVIINVSKNGLVNQLTVMSTEFRNLIHTLHKNGYKVKSFWVVS